jgi:hypothetical protein
MYSFGRDASRNEHHVSDPCINWRIILQRMFEEEFTKMAALNWLRMGSYRGFCKDDNESLDSLHVRNLLSASATKNLTNKTMYHGKVKGEVVPVLLTEHHAMEAY